MRRPSVIFLLSLILGILLMWQAVFALLSIGAVVGLSLIFEFNWKRLVLCITGIALGFALSTSQSHRLEQSPFAMSQGVLKEGQIQNDIKISGVYYQRDFLDEKSAWLKTSDGVFYKLAMSPYKTYPTVASGSVVTIEGGFSFPEAARNPNGFDSKKWLYSKKSGGSIAVKQIQLSVQTGDALEQFRYKIGKPLVEGLLQNTAFQQGPLAAGMLLGEDAWIPENVLDAYVASGTNHILSISGAHFGVLLLWIHKLLGKRQINYYLKKIAIWLTLGLFIWLIGMDTAAIRAYMMFLLMDLARLGYKQTDGLNSLCLTLIVMLLVNPFALWDIGLQLAFCAMYGLLVLTPFIESVLVKTPSKYFKKIASPLIMSLCASICLYPILRSQFNAFSWWSILYNIPVSLLSALYLPLGALEGFVTPFPFIARGIGVISGSVLHLMTLIVSTSLKLPRQLNLESMSSLQLGLYFWLMLIPLYFKQIPAGVTAVLNPAFGKSSRRIMLTFFAAGLVSILVFLPSEGFSSNLRIFYFDVGQGDGSAILTPKGQVIVIDSGLEKGQKQVADSLLKIGVSEVDYLIISHPHEDHIAGANAIIERLNVKNLVYFDGKYSPDEEEVLKVLDQAVKASGGAVLHWASGSKVQLEDALSMEVLHPFIGFDSDSANDESLVIQLAFQQTSFLFTGDISTQVEYDIMEKVKNQKIVLKVPHHGSATSSGDVLLNMPNLELAIVQVGIKNRYGHPKEAVLERYENHGIPLLRNDQSGCVSLISDGQTIEYRLQIEQ